MKEEWLVLEITQTAKVLIRKATTILDSLAKGLGKVLQTVGSDAGQGVECAESVSSFHGLGIVGHAARVVSVSCPGESRLCLHSGVFADAREER